MYVRQRVGSGGVPKLPVIGKSPGSGGRGAKAARLYSDNNENCGTPAPARGATSEDPEVELLNYIKTGDDVVEFYARQGKESEVKFFYCNRADTGIFFRPYDLVGCQPLTLTPPLPTRSMYSLNTTGPIVRLRTHKPHAPTSEVAADACKGGQTPHFDTLRTA